MRRVVTWSRHAEATRQIIDATTSRSSQPATVVALIEQAASGTQ